MIVLQCLTLYIGLVYFSLMAAVTIDLNEDFIDNVFTKVLNVSGLIFGPVLSLVAVHGWWNIKAIMRVCKITGYETETSNYPSLFLLILFTAIGFGVFISMVYDRTTDVQTELFTEDNSIFFTIISFYFRYNLRNQELSSRIRRRERREDRAEARKERAF